MSEQGIFLMPLISFLSLAVGVLSGVYGLRRSLRDETRKSASEMTMVIVKLEDISAGVAEIKSDLCNVKGELRELTERLIIAEQAVAQVEKRMDAIREKQNI